MKKVFLSVICTIAFTGCTSVKKAHTPSTSNNERFIESAQKVKTVKPVDLPDWIVSTPPGNSVGCAEIQKGNLLMAKQVSLAKAKVEFLTTKHVDLEASTEIRELVVTRNGQAATDTVVENQIDIKTKGKINHEQVIHEQQQVSIGNMPHWCVLYGYN